MRARFTQFAAKLRQFVGAVMIVVAVPALIAGFLAWRRGSDVPLLAAGYFVAGVYLAYEGLRLIRRRAR